MRERQSCTSGSKETSQGTSSSSSLPSISRVLRRRFEGVVSTSEAAKEEEGSENLDLVSSSSSSSLEELFVMAVDEGTIVVTIGVAVDDVTAFATVESLPGT